MFVEKKKKEGRKIPEPICLSPASWGRFPPLEFISLLWDQAFDLAASCRSHPACQTARWSPPCRFRADSLGNYHEGLIMLKSRLFEVWHGIRDSPQLPQCPWSPLLPFQGIMTSLGSTPRPSGRTTALWRLFPLVVESRHQTPCFYPRTTMTVFQQAPQAGPGCKDASKSCGASPHGSGIPPAAGAFEL